MAKYIGPNGATFDAHQLADDQQFPSGLTGRKGEWMVTWPDGNNYLVSEKEFPQQFVQKFPRMVGDPDPVPQTIAPPPTAA